MSEPKEYILINKAMKEYLESIAKPHVEDPVATFFNGKPVYVSELSKGIEYIKNGKMVFRQRSE